VARSVVGVGRIAVGPPLVFPSLASSLARNVDIFQMVARQPSIAGPALHRKPVEEAENPMNAVALPKLALSLEQVVVWCPTAATEP